MGGPRRGQAAADVNGSEGHSLEIVLRGSTLQQFDQCEASGVVRVGIWCHEPIFRTHVVY
jgi:hypothetical protein